MRHFKGLFIIHVEFLLIKTFKFLLKSESRNMVVENLGAQKLTGDVLVLEEALDVSGAQVPLVHHLRSPPSILG